MNETTPRPPPKTTPSPLVDDVALIVLNAVLQVAGGSTVEKNLPHLEHKVKSCVSYVDDPGTPWNVVIRVAPALYHEWKNRQRSGGSVTIISSTGLARDIESPLQLAQLLLPLVEEACRAGLAYDVRCHAKSAFLGITTPNRVDELYAAGKRPCPHCEQWCRGNKGVGWHVQQQHGVVHGVATARTERNEWAMIPYDEEATKRPLVSLRTTTSLSLTNGDVSIKIEKDPVLEAVQSGDLVQLKEVAATGYDLATMVDPKTGASLVSWAAGGGHLEVVRYLVETCGADASRPQTGRRSFSGRTPLHWAARNGHEDVVKYLVETCHVDVDAATADGTTAFCWACWQGHLQVAQVLLEAGAEANVTNRFGCSAVLWAAQSVSGDVSNLVELLDWLVSTAGCAVDLINTNGHGVLHKAAQRGRLDVCHWAWRHIEQGLLDETWCADTENNDSNDDTTARKIHHWLSLVGPDQEGCSPSDLAGMQGHCDVAVWLALRECLLVQTSLQLTEDSMSTPRFPPDWLVQERSGVAMDVGSVDWLGSKDPQQYDWEPWAGIRRMRAALKLLSDEARLVS